VRSTVLGLGLCVLVGGQAFAQGTRGAPDPGKPQQPIASVEARWEHVYCDLTELARTGASELSVRFQYRNSKKTAQPFPHKNLVAYTQALDAANNTLFGVLKDSSGAPISSTMVNVTAARPIPANGTQAHWARLQAPAESVKSVTVLVEGCLPFEDVPIGGTSRISQRSTPAAALASQNGEAESVAVEVTSANRQAGFLTLTFRYRNNGARPFRFPNQRSIRNAYVLDSANRKKYEVLRDQRQEPLCSESLVLQGQVGDVIEPGGAMTMWAKFAAPPDSTKTISVHVPFSPPFDNVPVTGTGGASTSAGSSVAGAVVGLDAALKDLNAKVTDAEIRIDLAADVLFDFDKAEIKKDAEASLQNLVTVIKANPRAQVTIEGHTDSKGADAYNQALSEQRAASVKQWLVANGKVDGGAISTRGWGKTKPVTHNTKPDGSDDPEGRAKNRRVEIVVRKGA